MGFKPDITHGGVSYPGMKAAGGILLPNGQVILPNEFEIKIPQHKSEGWHASNGQIGMSVLPEGKARMFKANFLKNWGGGNTRKEQWLCGVLDGIRTYLRHDINTGLIHVIVTKQELNA